MHDLTSRKQKSRNVSRNNNVTRAKHLHMFGMRANAINKLVGLDLTGADFVDGGEKWELLFHVLGFKHVVNFFGGDWTLLKIKIIILSVP